MKLTLRQLKGKQFVALGRKKLGLISGLLGALGYPAGMAFSADIIEYGPQGNHKYLYKTTQLYTQEGFTRLKKWVIDQVKPYKTWIQPYQIPLEIYRKIGWSTNPRCNPVMKKKSVGELLPNKALVELLFIQNQARILRSQVGYWDAIKHRLPRQEVAYIFKRLISSQNPDVTEQLLNFEARWHGGWGPELKYMHLGYRDKTTVIDNPEIESDFLSRYPMSVYPARNPAKRTYLWMRMGDKEEYHKFNKLSDAAKMLSPKIFYDPDQPISIGWGIKSLEISPTFVGHNFIALYWGDSQAQPIRDLTHKEQNLFLNSMTDWARKKFKPNPVTIADIGLTIKLKRALNIKSASYSQVKKWFDEQKITDKDRIATILTLARKNFKELKRMIYRPY